LQQCRTPALLSIWKGSQTGNDRLGDGKDPVLAMRPGLLKKGSGQESDFLPASHEQQPGKKIELYRCNK
jgi:hypothetical protein